VFLHFSFAFFFGVFVVPCLVFLAVCLVDWDLLFVVGVVLCFFFL